MPELNPLKDISLVSVFDPAIDISASPDGAARLDDYMTKRDIEIIRPLLVPTREPMLWMFAPLTGLALSFCDGATAPKVRHTRAFQAAFRKVEGLITNGAVWRPSFVRGETDDDKVLSDASMRALHGLQLASWIDELGKVVYERAQFSPFDAARYSPPPGYTEHLEKRLSAIAHARLSEQN